LFHFLLLFRLLLLCNSVRSFHEGLHSQELPYRTVDAHEE
jgi:hypothetical protein